MAIIDTVKHKAAAEPDHRIAAHGVFSAVLDMIDAATHTDMNEVRKVIASLRQEAEELAAAVVADRPAEAPPVMATPEQLARRDELRAKTDKTPAETAEMDDLEKLGDPNAPPDLGQPPRLSLIEVTRRDALRVMPNRSPALEAELAALEARSEPPPEAPVTPPAGWTPPNPPQQQPS